MRWRQPVTLARLVDGHLHALDRRRVVERVADIVFARPLQQHRRAAELLRDERRLDHEIPLRLAAKAAAEQRHMHGDILERQLERLGDVLARAIGALNWRPHLRLPVDNAGHRDQRLHRRLHQMLGVVLAGERGLCRLEGRIGVTLFADDLAGFRRRLRHGLAVGGRVVAGVGTVIPFHLQRIAALNGGERRVGDDGDAAELAELARHGKDALDRVYGLRRPALSWPRRRRRI